MGRRPRQRTRPSSPTPPASAPAPCRSALQATRAGQLGRVPQPLSLVLHDATGPFRDTRRLSDWAATDSSATTVESLAAPAAKPRHRFAGGLRPVAQSIERPPPEQRMESGMSPRNVGQMADSYVRGRTANMVCLGGSDGVLADEIGPSPECHCGGRQRGFLRHHPSERGEIPVSRATKVKCWRSLSAIVT